MRHPPEGLLSKIAIKSLNWSKETSIVAAVASAQSWAKNIFDRIDACESLLNRNKIDPLFEAYGDWR